jgi:hypothetical protein
MTPITQNYALNGFSIFKVSTLFSTLKCPIFKITAKICVGYCISLN